jgi:hypothetical protein
MANSVCHMRRDFFLISATSATYLGRDQADIADA